MTRRDKWTLLAYILLWFTMWMDLDMLYRSKIHYLEVEMIGRTVNLNHRLRKLEADRILGEQP